MGHATQILWLPGREEEKTSNFFPYNPDHFRPPPPPISLQKKAETSGKTYAQHLLLFHVALFTGDFNCRFFGCLATREIFMEFGVRSVRGEKALRSWRIVGIAHLPDVSRIEI